MRPRMNLNVNRNVRPMSGRVSSYPRASRWRAGSRGFTLVEMLVAMAVTLLLMAALGKGFAFIGESIRDSRVQVELTNDLRDVTNRLQEDLTRCTVPMQPSREGSEPAGYFMVYEGPVTDATSSLFLSVADPKNPAPESRYGDFDDYLAFTAVATGDSWFTGMVPRFILDQKTAELAGTAYNPNTLTMNDPVMIRSKYAEIVYFASPEYQAGLQYVDVDANGLPDRLRIHRRVLLIRPDLNITTGAQPPRLPRLNAGSDWLLGMAQLHQDCDLSLRRVSTNGIPDPAGAVAANSLADLAKPHNRFAHVRVPGGAVGLGNEYTSMPILALSPPATVLTSSTIAPPAMTTTSQPVVTPDRWSGFLRPEFVLAGARIGEDVLVPSAVGFDLKIFDPLAPVITTSTGVVVSSSDPAFRQALREVSSGTASVMQGDFVDLMYPVLAGGSLRGWQPRSPDRLTAQDAALPSPYLLTPFSGLVGFGTPANSYQPSLYRSGKILLVGSPGSIQIFQPTWDTFTQHYERDGLQQGLGRWRVADFGTPDANATGLDNSAGGSETSPPFLASPEAIKVSVRLEHRLNRQVRQLSIIHRDTK
jgi:prepilin-type N-terminal cleavage/methylation domain-containing protein